MIQTLYSIRRTFIPEAQRDWSGSGPGDVNWFFPKGNSEKKGGAKSNSNFFSFFFLSLPANHLFPAFEGWYFGIHHDKPKPKSCQKVPNIKLTPVNRLRYFPERPIRFSHLVSQWLPVLSQKKSSKLQGNLLIYNGRTYMERCKIFNLA